MSNTKLNIVSLCALLVGCGGADFGSAATDADGGVGVTGGGAGVAADAGSASGGTQAASSGGAGGQAGGASGGSSGSGGTPATGGGAPTGGVQGGGSGGEATGGAPVTGGNDGGGTGSGGAGTVTCKPPVVDATNLPKQITWASYEGKNDTACLTCLHSPCATCSVTWWPVTQSADGLTLTAKAAVQCGPVEVSLGTCGVDPSTSCATWAAPQITTTLVFSLQPAADGTGYTAVYRTNSDTIVTSYQGLSGACPKVAYDGAVNANQPMWTLFFALRDTVAAAEWPCGA